MKQELQSFLEAANYLQTFVPHLSHHTEPLQAILKKENSFTWDKNLNTSFQKIKSLLEKALLKPLRYYNRNKPVTLQCKTSLKGLEACIIQEGQPIAFASKSHRYRNSLCKHWERNPSHHIWLWEVPHLLVWKDICCWGWSQTIGNDQHEKSHCSPSQVAENAPPTAAVWHDYQIQTRQGNASSWCTKSFTIQNGH